MVERAGAGRWWSDPLVDAALVVATASLTLLSGIDDVRDFGGTFSGGAIALLVLMHVPLLVRRRYPFAVFVVCGVATAWYELAQYPEMELPFALFVAIGTSAAFSTPWLARLVGVASVAGTLVAMAFGEGGAPSDYARALALMAASWLVGDAVRQRRVRAEALEARNEELERRRAAEAEQAAAEERARIARELHDVVAHHVAMISLQAEGAQEVLRSDPDRAERALANVSAGARAALHELRAALGVLRDEAGSGRMPEPRLADVEQLVHDVASTSFPVRLQMTGRSRELPRMVELAGYRIVQESLTNIARHVVDPEACVSVRYGDDELDLEIADVGRSRGGEGGSGRGLIGMRERAEQVGGRFEAGPTDDGFVVRARLPIGAS
ncbi:MAG: histidine kinase [Actinomycetota bacterium]